ncbi:MAG: hypothetical protein QW051_03285 [Candidatus Aenigmatarchaeota archaeon]
MNLYEILSFDREMVGEICGIFSGSGSIYSTGCNLFLEVRVNKNEEHYFENYIKPIFERITQTKTKSIKRFYTGGYLIGLRTSNKKAIKLFHVLLEFPQGRKSEKLRIPKIILNNMDYWKAYVRGVFDTCGSIYLRKTNKLYKNPIIEIRSPSLLHLIQLQEILRDLGFNFWLERSNKKLRMAGWKNIERFFKEINPHNIAKIEKYTKIKKLH